MYVVLGTQPDILHAVAAVSPYNLWPFTSHMTAAKRVHLYLEFTANFVPRFNSKVIGIDIGNSLVGYSDSDWANDSMDCQSQGGLVSLGRIFTIS